MGMGMGMGILYNGRQRMPACDLLDRVAVSHGLVSDGEGHGV